MYIVPDFCDFKAFATYLFCNFQRNFVKMYERNDCKISSNLSIFFKMSHKNISGNLMRLILHMLVSIVLSCFVMNFGKRLSKAPRGLPQFYERKLPKKPTKKNAPLCFTNCNMQTFMCSHLRRSPSVSYLALGFLFGFIICDA